MVQRSKADRLGGGELSTGPHEARKQDEFSAGSRMMLTPPWNRILYPSIPRPRSIVVQTLSLVSAGPSCAECNNGASLQEEETRLWVFQLGRDSEQHAGVCG